MRSILSRPSTPARGEVAFRALVRASQRDPNVVGLILSGSRGTGRETRFSDFDVELIAKDVAVAKLKERYQRFAPCSGSPLEVVVRGLREFRRHTDRVSEGSWGDYSYVHVKVLLDRTGSIKDLVRDKATIPPALRQEYVASQLDHYINDAYRSLKCYRDGDRFAGHLEAVQSIPPLLDVLFAVEGRSRPYGKYLAWELKEFPLRQLPFTPEAFIRSLRLVLESGRTSVQQRLFVAVEREMRRSGFGRIYDDWGAVSLKLLRGTRTTAPGQR